MRGRGGIGRLARANAVAPALAGALSLLGLGAALPGRATIAAQSDVPAPALRSVSPSATSATPNANAVLARVKAGMRAQERPPFVVYTLVRRDTIDGASDFLNSYTLRVWCRTADDAALSRRVFGARTTGGAEFIKPAFDGPIDPGPPTADLLDVVRSARDAGSPSPAPGATPLAVIGTIAAFVETNYHVTFAGYDGADIHLRLEARRDVDRNRLTDLYIDRTNDRMRRAVAHDHLYIEGNAYPERFEIEFGLAAGVPAITAIHGQSAYSGRGSTDGGAPFHEVDYRFADIVFPAELPEWYFEPATYGAHRDELPSR